MRRIQQIAELIPAEYRKEILEMNIIDEAQAVASNPSMQYLGVIWKNYVERDFDPQCGLCYTRVLENFQALKKTFLAMEQGPDLLNEVKGSDNS
jgi:hypothetical protein